MMKQQYTRKGSGGGGKPVLIGLILYLLLTAILTSVFSLLINGGTLRIENLGWIRVLILCLCMQSACLATALLCRKRLVQSVAVEAVLVLACTAICGYLVSGAFQIRTEAVIICAAAAVLAVLLGMRRQKTV